MNDFDRGYEMDHQSMNNYPEPDNEDLKNNSKVRSPLAYWQ